LRKLADFVIQRAAGVHWPMDTLGSSAMPVTRPLGDMLQHEVDLAIPDTAAQRIRRRHSGNFGVRSNHRPWDTTMIRSMAFACWQPVQSPVRSTLQRRREIARKSDVTVANSFAVVP